MEDKHLNLLKYIKIGIISIILIIIVVFGYLFIMKQINNNKFVSYLEKQNYTKDKYNVYYKETKTNTETIINKAFAKEYVMYKNSTSFKDKNFTNISLQYDKNGNVKIIYKLESLSDTMEVNVLQQEGTYKKDKFECKILVNHGLETQCDLMEKEAKKYEKEIKDILKENKINSKYLESNSKKRSQL